MKKVIVTGAGGFIGGALTGLLLSKGITVYGVDISEKALERHQGKEGFIPVIADFTKYNQLHEMINDHVDVFYHFAWQGYGKDTQNFDVQIENVYGTQRACEAAAKIGCGKFVFACSSYEYQKSNANGSVGYFSIYGAAKTASKAFARSTAHRMGISFCGAIFTNVFGVGDKSNRSTNAIIRQLLRGENLRSVKGDALFDWSYIDDVTNGLYAIGDKGLSGKEYYVGSNRLRPFRDIISEVRDILAPTAEIEFGAYDDNAYVDYTGIDIYELYRDTGFYPNCDLRESILKTASWLKSTDPANSAGGYNLPSSHYACCRKGGGVMKKVIVTGAGGFIGGALTGLLLSKGITVYGVDISEKALERHQGKEGFIPVIADFAKYSQLHEMIDDNIDVFYHFARQGGYGSAFKDYRLQLNNSIADCDAISEAIKIGCRKFVFAGTVNEYEMNAYISADRIKPRYTYIYSAVKQTSEAICKTIAFNENIEYCAGRIAMAYGEGFQSMTSLPNVVMRNLMANMPCKLVEGKDLYDMIYIDDIVNAFYLIGESGENMKSYYVGHRNVGTFREIIEKIAEVLNPDCPLLFGTYPDAKSGVDYKNIDTDALWRDTGFECQTDFKESILKTASWLKSADSANSAGGGITK